MAELRVRPKTRLFGLGTLAVVLIAPAALFSKQAADHKVESTRNFALSYEKPLGWIEIPHNPQTLFSFRNPKSKVAIRGAANQIVSEFNPSPDLDRDGLTKQFAEITVDNLGWKAKILDVVECKGGSYRLIRRETTDRTVVTGIAVKGNTTILITMIGTGDAKKEVDGTLPLFRNYLASTSLAPTVIE